MTTDRVLSTDLEEQRLQFEREKLDVERWKALGVFVPLIVIAITVLAQVSLQQRQEKHAFYLEAAKIMMETDNPYSAANRASALAEIFPEHFEDDFAQSFSPADYLMENPEAKMFYLELLLKYPDLREETMKNWIELFGDPWAIAFWDRDSTLDLTRVQTDVSDTGTALEPSGETKPSADIMSLPEVPLKACIDLCQRYCPSDGKNAFECWKECESKCSEPFTAGGIYWNSDNDSTLPSFIQQQIDQSVEAVLRNLDLATNQFGASAEQRVIVSFDLPVEPTEYIGTSVWIIEENDADAIFQYLTETAGNAIQPYVQPGAP